ncbi:peroxidase family protein [Pseudoruegeria sp. HB172150]|uniref:peroxidase family protein n=1 Tax=Pseudoruegeria sp. HB172150 TaxID=2721164 RepID=UPI001555142C|nr:peroxidase family protein [Pseudoruegeria sp. HB172150]
MFKGQGHGMIFMEKQPDMHVTMRTSRCNTVSNEATAPDHEAVESSVEDAGGKFAYMFEHAAGINISDSFGEVSRKLDTLGLSTFEHRTLMGNLSAIFTYFGQFIDHDCTANTDREQDSPNFNIARVPLTANLRSDVCDRLMNVRTGRLDLDSLYGGDPGGTLERAMRDGNNPNKMRLGTLEGGVTGSHDFDLPRIGDLLDAEVLAEGDLPNKFFRTNNNGGRVPIRSMALIGDMRNDENLLVAQLQVAFLRFHNAAVSAGKDFDSARRYVTDVYHWLIINSYLKSVCDPEIVEAVIQEGAPLYSKIEKADDEFPMPLEFSVAAFRFGHSMLQQFYDYNSDMDGVRLLRFFELTGAGMLTWNGCLHERLPKQCKADWSRLTNTAQPAGAMDQSLPSDTSMLPNEEPGIQRLPTRNLRRSYVLNIPTGQAAVDTINVSNPGAIRKLSPQELGEGRVGEALEQVGLLDATPMWLYILREAEVFADGRHLGPLGSHIVANTLIGLILHDITSYLGRGDAEFEPETPDGTGKIGGFEDVLKLAGVWPSS